jgi:hypothetical protein
MREPWEWEEEDILRLVKDRASENISLEFKRCEALTNEGWKRELAKDVSALANSAGGTIVYGIIEDSATHEAESIDLGYDPSELNIETLEQVIHSRIQRSIAGVICKAVPLKKENRARVLYLIHVPESSHAPHMADHRFYKRHNFVSEYMEEYEVRERYRRETFPGKDVVEAWRDDAINPLIGTLEQAEQCLRNERWTWNHYYGSFGQLNAIGKQEQLSANAEDFIGRHSEVGDLLNRYDAALIELNNVGRLLFDNVAKGSFIREVFAWTTSEESLVRLKTENPNRIKGTTSTEIYAELFGGDRNEQERLDFLAEWAINGATKSNVDPMLVFWGAYGERFCNAVIYSDYRPNVGKARENLLEIGQCLMTILKGIRKELSERHNVAVEAARSSFGDPYGGLGLRVKPY